MTFEPAVLAVACPTLATSMRGGLPASRKPRNLTLHAAKSLCRVCAIGAGERSDLAR
jgi:hypothetical protein